MSQKKDKIPLYKESVFKVAEQIFAYPNKVFHIRMLEKETKLSTTAVINAVKELYSLKIIQVEDTALTKNIKADTGSESYRFYKMIYNLNRLKQSSFLNMLVQKFNYPEAIVIFGSYAKGEDIENSDIDVLIISPQKKVNDIPLVHFEKELKRKINIHVLESLKKSSPEFKNAIANGIIVYGYIKVV